MKDYLKMYQKMDEEGVKEIKKRLEVLQKAGNYPTRMMYPVTLQFELTGQCNLACKHCYNRSGDQDRKTLMTADKWCELAQSIVDDGGIFQCIISGGEPLLLGDRLFDIMDILHDDGTSFVVISNGFLLTKEKVRRFTKYRFFWFQISLDGLTAEVHDAFRGVSGSWEKAVTGALELSQAGIPLVIAHTVTPKNLNQIEGMVDFAYRMGASEIIMGEVLPSGRAIGHDDIILSREERNCLYGQITDLGKKYRGKIAVKRSAGLKTQMERYVTEVNAGGIIRPNGDFRLDCMAPFIIGNVLHDTVKDLWINKGIDAWHTVQVKEFIDSIDAEQQTGNVRNHVDDDILITE
ncbi:radical SAM protein [Selenomonas sp. KH1T6]|uniref:radical SAM protein n=1 Tax=Selenomonas sp. KH1T6 TaxID=3158784 RepID=UPI0009C101E7